MNNLSLGSTPKVIPLYSFNTELVEVKTNVGSNSTTNLGTILVINGFNSNINQSVQNFTCK